MSLLAPYWLFFLLIIPLLLGCVILSRYMMKNHWDKLVAKRLHSRLTAGAQKERYWLSHSLQMLALLLIIIAATRPTNGETQTTLSSHGHRVFVLVDSSRSMLCEDVSPSRLDLAHAKALQILEALPDAQVGLASFSGNLTLLSPYSPDHKALAKQVREIQPDSQQAGGSNLSGAVISTLNILNKTSSSAHALIIISDGEEHQPQTGEALELAKQRGIKIFTIGVGSSKGGTIPDPAEKDGKFKDRDGNVVYTKLERSMLQQLASNSGGSYTDATGNVNNSLQSSIRSMKKTETQGRTFTIPHETYTWFLVPAAFLLILSCMVKIRLKPQLALTPLLLVCFCFSQQLQAADKSAEHPSLKQKWIDEGIQHRQALKSLEAKKYKEAIKAFSKASSTATGETLAELHYGIAESHYQAAAYSHAQRHYAHALLHPSKPLQAHASYNLANSLFQQTWSKLQPPESTPFKDHLRQQMEKMKASEKDLPFDKSTLNQASVQWKEALEYYQFSYQTDATLSKAKSNEETVLKLLKELNEVLNEKPEKKEPDCKDPKDSEKNIPKDKKTDKPKDKDGDTPKQKDGEKGEPKDKGQKDPNKDGKGEPKEQSQKPKDGKGDKPNKDTEPKDGDKDGKGEKVDPNKPLEEQLNPDPNQSPEDFARNALEKLSDEQHNPKKLTIKKDFRTKNDW